MRRIGGTNQLDGQYGAVKKGVSTSQQDHRVAATLKWGSSALLALCLGLIWQSVAVGESVHDVATRLEEEGVFVAPNAGRDDIKRELAQFVEKVNIEQQFKVGAAIVEDPQPNETRFTKDLLRRVPDLDLVLVKSSKQVYAARRQGTPERDSRTEEELTALLGCALTEANKKSETIDQFGAVVAVYSSNCPRSGEDGADGSNTTPDQAENNEVVAERDSSGAETLVYVLDEVADDGVYVGETRTEIDEQALIEAVEEVKQDTGLSLIVVAPDKAQPTAKAFALRIAESSGKDPVLLFPKKGRATSSVFRDETMPSSAKVNSLSKNEACALKGAWRKQSEARAALDYGKRLVDGCPIEPPTIILLLAGLFALLVGGLGVIVIKERDFKEARHTKDLPPPKSSDRVENKSTRKQKKKEPKRNSVQQSWDTNKKEGSKTRNDGNTTKGSATSDRKTTDWNSTSKDPKKRKKRKKGKPSTG